MLRNINRLRNMAKDSPAKADIRSRPMIPPGRLAGAMNVGQGAVRAAAHRLKIEVARMPNGRDLLSIEQAEAVARVLSGIPGR
jgi:hypothetical protein